MLLCKGNRLYTGYATNVDARYQKHCTGKGARFTKAFPPLQLLGSIQAPSKSVALQLEKAIKQLKAAEKWQLVRELQESPVNP